MRVPLRSRMRSLREADGEASLLDGLRDVHRYSRMGDAGIGGGVGLRTERSGHLEKVGDCGLRGRLLDGMQ